MKIRLVVALAGLVISFALPTFAQQKDTVDPQIIEQLNALTKKFIDAVDNNDAAAVAALYGGSCDGHRVELLRSHYCTNFK